MEATLEHPFYVQDKGWISLNDLQIGDGCVNVDGEKITLVSKEFVTEEEPVYNFQVENAHTYFVGESDDESVLVHNDCSKHGPFYAIGCDECLLHGSPQSTIPMLKDYAPKEAHIVGNYEVLGTFEIWGIGIGAIAGGGFFAQGGRMAVKQIAITGAEEIITAATGVPIINPKDFSDTAKGIKNVLTRPGKATDLIPTYNKSADEIIKMFDGDGNIPIPVGTGNISSTMADITTATGNEVLLYANYQNAINAAQKAYEEEQCRLLGLLQDSVNTGVNNVHNGTGSLDVQICFISGTPILTDDEEYKSVEDICENDEVYAKPHNNPNAPARKCRVVRVFRNDPQSTWKVTFDNGLVIQGTKEHPFYVTDKGWTTLYDLRVGDCCINANDEKITLVSKEFVEEKQPVFNFEVEDAHTYFVGTSRKDSILVHNDCPYHSYNLFPEFIDKWANADKNGLNLFLFGRPKPICNCHVVTPKGKEIASPHSWGKLAAHTPGGMSLQNQIKAKDQIAGYVNDAADIGEAAAWELAMVPFGVVVSDEVIQYIVQHARKHFKRTTDAAKIESIVRRTMKIAEEKGTIYADPLGKEGRYLFVDKKSGRIVVVDGSGGGSTFIPEDLNDWIRKWMEGKK